MGAGPENFEFVGNRASVSADERYAERIANDFKIFIANGNRAYQEQLAAEAKARVS